MKQAMTLAEAMTRHIDSGRVPRHRHEGMHTHREGECTLMRSTFPDKVCKKRSKTCAASARGLMSNSAPADFDQGAVPGDTDDADSPGCCCCCL